MTGMVPGAGNPGNERPAPMAPGPVPDGYIPLGQVGAAAFEPPEPALDAFGPAPHTKRQARRWFFYALAGFVVAQISGSVFGLVAGHIDGKTGSQISALARASVPPEWYVVSSLAGIWVGFVGAPWLASATAGTRRFLADLGLRFHLIDLPLGVAVGLVGQFGISLLYLPFQHDIHNYNGPTQKLTGGAHGIGVVVIVLATAVLAPFAEELFFRGLLFKALLGLLAPRHGASAATQRAAIVAAVALDGLLFGLAHAEWVQLAGLALFGMVLATVMYKTGRLGMNMVAHATFNLVAVLVYLNGGVIR